MISARWHGNEYEAIPGRGSLGRVWSSSKLHPGRLRFRAFLLDGADPIALGTYATRMDAQRAVELAVREREVANGAGR